MKATTIQRKPRSLSKGGEHQKPTHLATHVAINEIDDEVPNESEAPDLPARRFDPEDFSKFSLEQIPDELAKSLASIGEGSGNIQTGHRLVVKAAWRAGQLLNHAKLEVKKAKGKWEPWRAAHWEKHSGQTARTAQRYMALARRHASVEDLFQNGKSLREIYITCGMLKPLLGTGSTGTKGGGHSGKGEGTEPTWRSVQAGVTAILANLRELKQAGGALSKSGKPLPTKTREHVEAARIQIEQFFSAILGTTSNNE